MKRIHKFAFVLLALLLSLSAIASASSEKEYIVYPTFTPFAADNAENPAGFIVVSEEELSLLLEEGLVNRYEENIEGEFHGTYNEIYTDYFRHYDLNMVNAAEAWENGCFGQGVKVAVIDSGVNAHTEFGNRLLPGYDYVRNAENTPDTIGHGTFVAGMVASTDDGYGTRSLASKASIVPLKVDTSNGKPDLAAVCNAIYAAVDIYNCDVINLSLGFVAERNSIQSLESAINHAVGKGAVIVASVGNYNLDSDGNAIINNALCYPAAYENVIGVGSVSYETGEVSYFSVRNESVFVVAPGENVKSPIVLTDESGNTKSGYATSSGTSFSTPIVSSAFAALKSANRSITQTDAMELLKSSASDAGEEGYDTSYGYGILDVGKAFNQHLGIAQFDAPKSVSYVIRAKDSALNGAITVDSYTVGHIGSQPLNKSLTVKAAAEYSDGHDIYTFAYWTNGNGTFISDKAEYTVSPKSSFTLEAVYDKASDTQATTEKHAEFWNGNGVLLDSLRADESGFIAEREIPKASLTGYSFDFWKTEDGSFFDSTTELADGLTRIVAQFKDDESELFTLKIHDNGKITPKSGIYGAEISYEADDPDNFVCWQIMGETISYDPILKLFLWDDLEISAVYDTDCGPDLPEIALFKKGDEPFIVYSAPPLYEILDVGIVFGFEGTSPTVSSFCSKASAKNISAFGQFTASSGDPEAHVSARGYLIYRNKYTNSTRVIYSD